jgi:putative peptidoglycan lipid II flippase
MPEPSETPHDPESQPQGDGSQGGGVMKKLGIATALMMASVLASRFIGFARDIIIAAQHGATDATDAYYSAFLLPDILAYFLAGGTLSITFIPLFAGYLARGDEEGGWRLFSTVATGVGILVLLGTIVGEIFAPQLVPLVVPGFKGEALELCVRMTRIVLPNMMCFAIGGLLQATLLSKERFGWVALSPVAYSVCLIGGGVVLGPWVGVEGFAWGALVGAIVGPLLIPALAVRKSLRYRPRFDFGAAGFREYLWLAVPLMLGATLISVDEWLLKGFGSFLEEGTVTWLQNARRLMLVPVAILGQAVGQAALPFLTRLYSQGKHQQLADTLTDAMRNLAFWSLIASGALVVLARPAVFAAYRRYEFSVQDAEGTATLLVGFALGIGAWSVQSLIVRGFYARKNTLEPMIIGTGVAVLAVPIYWGLSEWLGGFGLSIASTLGIVFNTVVLTVAFRYRHAPVSLRKLGLSAAKAAVAVVPAAGAAWFVLAHLGPLDSAATAVVHLAVGGTTYALLALGISALIRADELSILTHILRRVRAKLRPSSGAGR